VSARWAAVVVNYESGGLLLDCVQSVLADPSAGDAEVVVVDNGSTDGSVDALRDVLPDIPVVSPGRNLGYASAANRGIAATRAPVVAVCNSDINICTGAAGALVTRLESDREVGAIGPRVQDPDGTHYPSARSVPRLIDAIGHGLLGPVAPGNRFTRRYRQLDADPARSRDVDWVSGAALWLRRDALDDVGGWDERYFMYTEDVDLCLRLRKAGWRVVYEPAGLVTHVQGVSTARRPYRMIVEHHRSTLRFARTHWTGPRRLLLAPAAAGLALRGGVHVALRALNPLRRVARSGRSKTTG
jgi:N-acetylglucosaminyl-diphospho-decaprenol L-rhamnosyltransferase